MVYADRGDHAANQGDVFEGLTLAGRPMDGMITAHDCVLDKYLVPNRITQAEAQHFVVSVAPVHPLHLLTGDRPANARAGRMPRYFYLPAEGEREELVADLWLEQPMRFKDLLTDGERVTSLSDEWLGRLWQQFMRLKLGEDYKAILRRIVCED